MLDFSPLLAHGPLGPAERHDSLRHCLEHYLEHYGMAPLLTERAGLEVGYLDTKGYRLWTQVWSPPAPVGTAFVVHGYYDHLGLYRHLIERLLAHGWRVILWDLPGHGLSSGARATIADFDEYGDCLRSLQQQLMARGLAPRPWLGVGQSTGASILATDALRHGGDDHWSGLALLAPLVRPRRWPQSSLVHSLVGPFVQSIPRRFNNNSNDAEFASFLRERDPLQPDRLPVEWISAMRRWIPQLLALPASQIPTLILQGEQDRTVDWQWNLKILTEKFPHAQVYRQPAARHHLVNETEAIRQDLLDTLGHFIDRLITPDTTPKPHKSPTS
ncbi:MAG: alpha/beta hydrolase [Halomonas sp.]|uniref:alpha/beta hydrolase n=1 Tax=Halomonas sp. TaxID=1486246 RepID=UPI003F8E0C17